MNKFKAEDRIAVYLGDIRMIAVVSSCEGDLIKYYNPKGSVRYYYIAHYKACRKLVKKESADRIWVPEKWSNNDLANIALNGNTWLKKKPTQGAIRTYIEYKPVKPKKD